MAIHDFSAFCSGVQAFSAHLSECSQAMSSSASTEGGAIGGLAGDSYAGSVGDSSAVGYSMADLAGAFATDSGSEGGLAGAEGGGDGGDGGE